MRKYVSTAFAGLAVALAGAAFGAWTYEGKWGSYGAGNGLFNAPRGVAAAPGGNVYVADWNNSRIQYFTATGSYLGKWGTYGSGNGQFNSAEGLNFNITGSRIYVADEINFRIQYFNRNQPAVEPASLGRVKALFR